jgi:hypothetical protein
LAIQVSINNELPHIENEACNNFKTPWSMHDLPPRWKPEVTEIRSYKEKINIFTSLSNRTAS